MRNKVLLFILGFFAVVSVMQAQTGGKVAGTVTDAKTGEALIGVNVMIEGTSQGAATNVDGFYSILNVSPGSYNVKASYIGYSPVTIQNVKVNIDQTTLVDIQMQGEDIAMGEVVIVATEPVVQQDVASSRANISAAEIEALPTTDINTAVGLQAGILNGSDGPSIRGGSARETAYIVNGMAFRDERDNTPYTNISMTAVEDIQVQTGGFNAEYGNIRSGIVNVVTREGSKDKYNFRFVGRYRPAGPKQFGDPANTINSFFIRPYVDPAVAWTGTKSGAWNEFQQAQYPEFVGWNAISQQTLEDDEVPDLTPQEAQNVFLWQHRKDLDIEKPDYEADMTLSGPVPAIGKYLGDLRFSASFRKDREMYLIPLSEDSYQEYSGQLKLTSNLTDDIKLMIQGLYGEEWGTTDNNSGSPGVFRDPWTIATQMDRVSYIETRIFTNDYWAPTKIIRNNLSAKITHVLGSNTFYEASFSRFASDYSTNPGPLRDTTAIKLFGENYWLDEAPFGFMPLPSTAINGMRMGVGMSNSRDSSFIATYTTKFDITSQLNQYNEVKAGFEFVVTDHRINYASVDQYLPSGRYKSKWNTTPLRGGLYVQDKLEFEGMIANIGVRLDYLDPNEQWYVYPPYTPAFSAQYGAGIDTLLQREDADMQLEISPRLGIAFPITINSKIFFNYGHQRTLPTPENLYMLRQETFNDRLLRIANPNLPLEKSVQYELGYEHNLFDQFLLRVAGYYKDVTDVPYLVSYRSQDDKVNYQRSEARAYSDIRGFELTLSKNRGRWVQGFVNYTYSVSTSGHFGFRYAYENTTSQKLYEITAPDAYQSKPIPRPYARANINFFTPEDFGPELAGIHPFGSFRINILGSWRNGYYFTWAGGGSVPGIQYNVQWRDSYNMDMRIAKNFDLTGGVKLELFADISNVFNHKYMSEYGFFDGTDYNLYMKSLHLSQDVKDELGSNDYGIIPGDDKPGDYRIAGEYQPIISNAPDFRTYTEGAIKQEAIYYDFNTQGYYRYAGGEWNQVPQNEMDEILENKRYIDMPNMSFFTFLNPRDIYWGLKFSIELN